MAGLALSLSAGSFVPSIQKPATTDNLPATYEPARPDTAAAPAQWWTGFNDRTLNRLVDSVLVRNLDLRIAVARVEEVQNRYRISRAGQFPTVGFTLDGSRTSTPTNSGTTGSFSENIPNFPDRFNIVSYSASLGFSYELDFWGRARAKKKNALHEFVASRADAETALIGVISETIATYHEITELDARLALTRENTALLEERSELSTDRYRRGLISSFELYTIQQEFEDARSNLPVLESLHREATGRLAVLLGSYPKAAREMLSQMPDTTVSLAPIPAGLPSELLRQRPDLIAAEERLEATRQRIGIARAERFPRLALTAAGGTQSSDLSNLVNTGQQFTNLAASLTAPIFNAGALKANTGVAWAQYRQQAAVYEKAVLTAFKEVDAALVNFQKQKERYTFLRKALVNAQASADTQRERYVRGVGDYLAYLDARRNLVRVELSLATAQRAVYDARLAVHRALGGAWLETPRDPS